MSSVNEIVEMFFGKKKPEKSSASYMEKIDRAEEKIRRELRGREVYLGTSTEELVKKLLD
jgi:hypothetical protein